MLHEWHFIPFRNVYWGYWVTATKFSSAGWNPGKCNILLKHGCYLWYRQNDLLGMIRGCLENTKRYCIVCIVLLVGQPKNTILWWTSKPPPPTFPLHSTEARVDAAAAITSNADQLASIPRRLQNPSKSWLQCWVIVNSTTGKFMVSRKMLLTSVFVHLPNFRI